jgi:hypothetical protein
MKPRLKVILFILGLALTLSGCYMTPVRHLASDVGLLKIGVSTREDVLVYLGEPDEEVDLGNGRQQWLYKDVEKGFFEKLPLIGQYLGNPEIMKAQVILTNNIVTECTYQATDDDEMGWSRDFSWQKKED